MIVSHWMCSNAACSLYLKKQAGKAASKITGSPLLCRSCKASLEEFRTSR